MAPARRAVKPRRGRAKENPAALRRAEWHAHVRATPLGMVPQLIPCYGVAMGTRWTRTTIREHFQGIAPRRYWPDWLRSV